MAAAVALKKKSAVGFAAALKATATPAAPKKSKTKIPVLDTPDHVKEQVDAYIAAKNEIKRAEGAKAHAEWVIIDFVRDHQDADGMADNFRSSYAVTGTSGDQVKYVSSNRFTISAEDTDQVTELLGDNFDDLIAVTHDVRLKDEVFKDERLQGDLMALIGDRFSEFFETTQKLSVKEEFDRKLYRAVGMENLAILRTFCKPYKPSLR